MTPKLIVVPATSQIVTQHPPVYFIPGVKGTNETWRWNDLAELQACIQSILASQGYDGKTPNMQGLDLRSFRPVEEFTWLEVIRKGSRTMCIGDLDECPLSPAPGKKVLVPAGWGVGVSRLVLETGVVHINTDTLKTPSVTGTRWNAELYPLTKKDLKWR